MKWLTSNGDRGLLFHISDCGEFIRKFNRVVLSVGVMFRWCEDAQYAAEVSRSLSKFVSFMYIFSNVKKEIPFLLVKLPNANRARENYGRPPILAYLQTGLGSSTG
jgi:hypothetical protein